MRGGSAQESDRPRTEEEWKQIKESWKADCAANTKVLRFIQRDHRPGSANHRKIDEVMKRERAELDVILSIIDILHDSDKILHPSDARPSGPPPGQSASAPSQESKFCQFCGLKMPPPALFCPACGKRQL